jgi:hypothetical protein
VQKGGPRALHAALILWAGLSEAFAASWTGRGPVGGAPAGIAINPKTTSIAYAPTRGGGVFKTTDSGAGWSPSNVGLSSLDVRAVAIDPAAPGTLYAATANGIERSTSAAASWTPTVFPGGEAFAVAVDPAMPTRVFAGGVGSLCRSSDKGLTWSQCTTGLPDQARTTALPGHPATTACLPAP